MQIKLCKRSILDWPRNTWNECFLEVSMYVELKKLLKHCTRNEREIFGHDNVIKKFIQ